MHWLHPPQKHMKKLILLIATALLALPVFDRVYRFTDTWMERNGKWECIAEQVALVKGTP